MVNVYVSQNVMGKVVEQEMVNAKKSQYRFLKVALLLLQEDDLLNKLKMHINQ